MGFYKFKICTLVIFVLIFAPFYAGATMQSGSYVIYENVMHNFDGPVISNVAVSVSGITATITWDTNVIADGFVIYDTDAGFGTSKEQGSSVKNTVAHSVIVSGLTANTTYYYRVKSTRVNGGETTDNTARSFITGADPNTPAPAPEPTPPASGGGILIIDKTDKAEPEITDVAVKNITDKSAEITWTTNEPATSFVEYGITAGYGAIYGAWSSSTAHSVILDILEPATLYHFRALSSDGWGNVGRSADNSFTTKTAAGEEASSTETKLPEPNQTPSQTIIEFIRRLLPDLSLNRIGANPYASINSMNDLANLVPAPILSGEPRVEIGANDVKIFWTTDINANSLVAVAPETSYRAGAREPYIQVVGDSETMTRDHQVNIYGLAADTIYHYQLRGKANLGPMAYSRDFTFRTSIEELKITSFFSQIIDEQTATFKWVTNKEADSAIKAAPYHGNVLAIDEAKVYKDSNIGIIHEIKVADFTGGVIYNIELISMDSKGNVASEIMSRFSTSESDTPPEISHIKADSTVFLDRDNKTQTIISWMTNEPSTSRIHFQEGVQSSDATLTEATDINTNYTKEHIMVVTKFKPGVVYSFRVESVDSAGNTSLSPVHTFMTAKKKESIIQVIIRILEETFGWVKKLN